MQNSNSSMFWFERHWCGFIHFPVIIFISVFALKSVYLSSVCYQNRLPNTNACIICVLSLHRIIYRDIFWSYSAYFAPIIRPHLCSWFCHQRHCFLFSWNFTQPFWFKNYFVFDLMESTAGIFMSSVVHNIEFSPLIVWFLQFCFSALTLFLTILPRCA